MLKTVYFDLGNVLVFFSHTKMLDQMTRCTGLAVPQLENLFFKTDLRERYEKGFIRTEDVYRAILKEAKHPFSLHEFTTAFTDIFTPNTELWPVVEALKKQGIRLILLSNTSESHFQYIRSHYPILQLFDHKILSYEVGAWKPEIPIFEKALQHAQCAPSECFYTDDIPEFIASAREVGLPGEIFTTVADLEQQISKRLHK